MASHISVITWSRPRMTLVPRVIFSRSWPSRGDGGDAEVGASEVDADGEVGHGGQINRSALVIRDKAGRQ